MEHAPSAIHDAVERLVDFFEQLQPQNLRQLPEFYAVDARFKDPFNDVNGLDAIEQIFNHMFKALDSPHFIVTERIVQGSQCFLGWDFRFKFNRFDTGTWQTIRGGTHLKFNENARVTLHRDYWDAAEELYEKIPLIRALMRWLKRRANS